MRVEGTLTELAVRQSVTLLSCPRIQSYSPSGPTHDDHPGQLFRPQLIEEFSRVGHGNVAPLEGSHEFCEKSRITFGWAEDEEEILQQIDVQNFEHNLPGTDRIKLIPSKKALIIVQKTPDNGKVLYPWFVVNNKEFYFLLLTHNEGFVSG